MNHAGTNEPLSESPSSLYASLERITDRPQPFEFYTAKELWTDEHTSQQMLSYHLNDDVNLSSRRASFIDESVGWMADRFRLSHGSRFLDFGCGPGLYTSRLARLGATVSGVDFSARSIAYARRQAEQQGLEIDYHEADYLQFQPEGRFDLVTLIMCDFCALSPLQRATMLENCGRLLNPDGRVVLDVHSLSEFEQRDESSRFEKNLLDGFWSPDPYFGFLNTFKYELEKVLLDKYTIIGRSCKREIYNWLQCFSVDMLERELESTRLEMEEVFGDVAGRPYETQLSEFAVVLKLRQ